MTMFLPSSFDIHLVILSVIIAAIASYVALTLAERVTVARGRIRKFWLLGGAVSMGTGIWSMHFTGMLAFHLPIPVAYDVPIVILSLVIASIAAGMALFVVSRPCLPRRLWLLGGLCIGIGIASMHYTGMAAMRMTATMVYNPAIFAMSVVIAVVVSLVALWLCFKLRAVSLRTVDWRRLASATIMGFAIAGMHYTGMAAATFTQYMPASLMSTMPLTPTATFQASSPLLVSASELGSGAIALVTLLALGLALGIAFIDRRFSLQEQALAESRHHLRTVVANAPIILLAFDNTGVVTLAEGQGLVALGPSAESLVGQKISELCRAFPDVQNQIYRALTGEEFTGICTIRDLWFETRWTPLRGALGEVSSVVTVATDITERRRAEIALHHQAHHDILTGLPNRLLLQQSLIETLAASTQHGQPLVLILMDLDRFKEVNDTLGHEYGDVLLQLVSQRLQDGLRPSDVVARLGGDEFAILLPNTETGEAIQLTQRLLVALSTPYAIDSHTLHIGSSAGIAVAPLHGQESATLLRRADVAMYVAKRAGSGYAIYDVAHDQHSVSRLALESDLRNALAAQDFVLYYQPKVSLASNQISHAEALVRWHHPQQGMIPPDQFIPLAELTGLITPLTEWVLQEALRQLCTWQERGLCLHVAINISMHTLHDPCFPSVVERLLRQYDVAPERLTLEVTESALMADPCQAHAVLTKLSSLGLLLSIDDFGTGYSSLGYLKQLPVDEIKIDKSFVLSMNANPQDTAIVRSVTDLSHNLGLQVVAEGVETAETLHTLQSLGCDVVQGYYFSRPLPGDDLYCWITSQNSAVA